VTRGAVSAPALKERERERERERETENFQGLYLCFMLISNQIGGSFAVCGITGLLVG
jgi:hypothetical protein